jgi:hypothetical protein
MQCIIFWSVAFAQFKFLQFIFVLKVVWIYLFLLLYRILLQKHTAIYFSVLLWTVGLFLGFVLCYFC